MASRDSGKTKLSKGILEMKFMKRSKDLAEKEDRDEEGRLLFASQISDGMRAGISNYILESSFIPCENLIEGRLSFKGMNPEIERLLELEEIAKRRPVDRSMKADISDLEMAQFKQSLVETVASKFKSKKQRKQDPESPVKREEQPPRKKTKFMKPSDD